jgi:hypothetical protein
LDVQLEDGLWRQIVGKDHVEEHLIECNVEHLSHAGATPLIYMELGRTVGHNVDTPMADDILEGTFKLDALSKDALAAIVKQLRQHPTVIQIINPIVTEEDFKSAFKFVLDKMVLSLSDRGIHHYKACAEGSEDGLAYTHLVIHVAMVTVSLAAGLYPEQWKKAIDVMLEKIMGVVRSNKL